MTSAVVAGLTAGFATLAVSEIVLRRVGRRSGRAFWKALTAGAAARAAWVLIALASALSLGLAEPRAFALSLLASYFAAQVIEGTRYRRAFERR